MPRKSTASVMSPEGGAEGAEGAPRKSITKEDGLSVEDLNLPKSIVQRLAKGVLPANTQIQKDAQLAMSKSATVFVNYLTAHAQEAATRNGRKNVMPTDVFDAMQELEFDDFLPRLMAEVTKFTSIQADKRNSYRKKVREEKKANKDTGGEAAPGSANGQSADVESPPAKRARRSSMDNGEHHTGSEDEGDGDDAADDVPDEEDEADDDEEMEEEPAEEGLTEDLIEVRESEADEDDEMADGDESD